MVIAMDVFVPNVMEIDENNQWQTLFYPNLPLTYKRLKECRRELRINADCLQRIESGESLMCPSLLEVIADFYNKPIEYFTCSTRHSEVQMSIFDLIAC